MDTTNAPDGTQETTPQVTNSAPASLEQALAEIEKLRGINKEVISARDSLKQKLRGFEEDGKYKELYEKRTSEFETLRTTLKTKAVDSALREILQKAGARSVDTVAKLVDKSKVTVSDEDFSVTVADIETQIEELKKTDPILFGIAEGANPPPVKRPAGGEPAAGYEQELRACRTQVEIEAVMKKYGK